MSKVPARSPSPDEDGAAARVGRSSVRWREVIAFGVLGLALCAVFTVVLVLLGIDSRQIGLWGMLTPAIAAFIVVWRRPGRRKGFGAIARITSMWPLRPVGRTVTWCMVGLFLTAGAALGAVLLGAVTGVLELDLQNFSMLRTTLAETFDGQVAAEGDGFPALWPFVAWLLLQLAGVIPLLPLAFGEELGWRGYLVPALMPLGLTRMLVVSCIYWVVWHLPLFLYNLEWEGLGDVLGWSAMFVFGQAAPQVIVITWLRIASRSVWPAILMHASSSLGFAVVTIMSEAGTSLNPSFDIGGQQLSLVNLMLGVIGVVLLAAGQLRVRPDDPGVPDPSSSAGHDAGSDAGSVGPYIGGHARSAGEVRPGG